MDTVYQNVGGRPADRSIGPVVSCLHQTTRANGVADRSPTVERKDDHHLGKLSCSMTSRKEMDPYRELELYLARVIVSK